PAACSTPAALPTTRRPRAPPLPRCATRSTNTVSAPARPTSRRVKTVLEIGLGDVVRLRKPHPRGGYDWQVTRLGADFGLRCHTCGRRLRVDRATQAQRVQQVVVRAGAPGGGEPEEPGP